MRHYVTYCDIGYAARALVLAESLQKHEPHPYELIVVCFDELTRLVIEELAPGNISTVPLHKVEERFPGIAPLPRGANSARVLLDPICSLSLLRAGVTT